MRVFDLYILLFSGVYDMLGVFDSQDRLIHAFIIHQDGDPEPIQIG